VPPEVRSYAAERSTPGRALDLGCGTGTTSVYLARLGWEVVGVDFAPAAISRAGQRAFREGLTARTRFLAADVTKLPDLGAPFDLAIDVGCFHSLSPEGRRAYAASLARLVVSGGTYLLYAFLPHAGQPGVTRAEVEQLMDDAFALHSYTEGTGRPSAWYRFERRQAP
jgi:cyclopropane fatty-acyl-phospholipid synthase-like methyltransferase